MDKRLEYLLPELFRIIAKDLDSVKSQWFSQFDTFADYVEVIDRLYEILTTLDFDEEERAINVLQEFIDSRKKPRSEWLNSYWLASLLTQNAKPKTDTDDKFRDLLALLAMEMAKDIRYFAHSFYIYDYLLAWTGIFNCILDLFFTTDALKEATEVIDGWLKISKDPERLWTLLGKIRDKYLGQDEEDSRAEEQEDTAQEKAKNDDELPF